MAAVPNVVVPSDRGPERRGPECRGPEWPRPEWRSTQKSNGSVTTIQFLNRKLNSKGLFRRFLWYLNGLSIW